MSEDTPFPKTDSETIAELPNQDDPVAEAQLEDAWGAKEYERSAEALSAQIDSQASESAEIAAHTEEIKAGAAALIETFQVKPEFFDEPKRSTIFMSLAYMLHNTQLTSQQPEPDQAEIDRRNRFINGATLLLTRKFTHTNTEVIAEHERLATAGRSPHETQHILRRHEHRELTSALNEYVQRHETFAPIDNRLEGADREPFELHVLSMGTVPLFDSTDNGIEIGELLDWQKGLQRRSDELRVSMPDGDLLVRAAAFANEADGVRHIYMPMGSAEMVLARERGIVLSKYAGNAVAAIIKTLQHERAHTYSDILCEQEFGVALEERWAEYLSGDYGGALGSNRSSNTVGSYGEIKQLFNSIGVLTGHETTDMLEKIIEDKRARRATNPYRLLADSYGLESVAEIAAAHPDAYIDTVKSPLTRNMLEALGGTADIIRRVAVGPRANLAAARERVLKNVGLLRQMYASRSGEPSTTDAEVMLAYGPLIKSVGLVLAEIPHG